MAASRVLFNSVQQRRIRLVATPALFLEYEAVLKRASQVAAHGYSIAQIDRILELLTGFTDQVDVHYQWRPQLRDPNDEMVLEAAVAGGVDVIVTHNVRDFLPAARQFGVRVVTPGVLLKERFGHE